MTDPERLDDLLDRYADQSVSREELGELEDILRRSPPARDRFWSALGWNAALLTWGEGPIHEGDSAGPGQARPPRSPAAWPGRHRHVAVAVAAAIAVVIGLVGGIGLGVRGWRRPPAGITRMADVAIVTSADGAAWAAAGPQLGQSVGPGRLVLEQGEVVLGLASGAEVAVRGPAEFSIRSGLQLQLGSGGLAARVPPEAEGFIVETPSVNVVDLGTMFGVRAAADGVVDVRVFEGVVETHAGIAPEARLGRLTAGMSRRFLADGRDVDAARLEPDAFPSLPDGRGRWPVTAGGIHLLAAPPGSARGAREQLVHPALSGGGGRAAPPGHDLRHPGAGHLRPRGGDPAAGGPGRSPGRFVSPPFQGPRPDR